MALAHGLRRHGLAERKDLFRGQLRNHVSNRSTVELALHQPVCNLLPRPAQIVIALHNGFHQRLPECGKGPPQLGIPILGLETQGLDRGPEGTTASLFGDVRAPNLWSPQAPNRIASLNHIQPLCPCTPTVS
jgi:hypothetical protein